MPPANSRSLTDRQAAVIERIDRRVPIKVIAQELGVSETRINQHIRALKDIFEVDSLNELVEEYRASNPAEEIHTDRADRRLEDRSEAPDRPLSEPVYTKNQLPDESESRQFPERDDPGKLVLSDVLPMLVDAPWGRREEPKVVPGVLDGEHAVLFRFAAIIAIAFGVLAAVVLTVTAAVSVSEAMDGKARVPAEEEQSSR